MKKTGGLGKGLDALIPDSYVELIEQERLEQEKKINKFKEEQNQHEAKDRQQEERKSLRDQVRLVVGEGVETAINTKAITGLRLVSLDEIVSNPFQPRQRAEEAKIEELAASIKEKGLLQPVVLKQVMQNSYEIICGERRVLAARKNGWSEIPAIVKDVAGDDMLELALIENIQREDLNAIEEAEAYRKLVAERGLAPEDVGVRVGKDRSTVTNMLRLLRLPDEVQEMIKSGMISNGHARALLGLPSPEHQRHLANRIVTELLSVRQVEEIVQRTETSKRRAKKTRRLDADIIDLEHKLSERLGTKVRLFARKNNKGRIEVQYNSLDDLDRILDTIGVQRG